MSTGKLYEDPEFPPYEDPVFPPETIWKRPYEICKDPKFIHDGASRFDVYQGALDNGWFIAAVAALASRPELFKRVVPEGQNFGPDYLGQFRFTFWRYGKWIKVLIDDRLPTKEGKLVFCSNRTTTDEFWPALLEKAYAKLNGSYEAMDGGHQEDALVDLTGGIGQRIDLIETKPQKFFQFLLSQNNMNTLMGCALYQSPVMEGGILPSGLVSDHAYSITSIKTLMTKDGEKQLLRLRNPWGKTEWKGAWSDNDEKMDEETRQELGIQIKDDGEFWMSFEDWLSHFQELELCHLPPDVKLDDRREWKEIAFHGSWEKKVGTEGSHGVVLSGSQSGGGTNTVIISLMQLCAPQDRVQMVLDLYETKSDTLREIRTLSDHIREISESISLEDGTYVIRPSTPEPDVKGEYLLRIYTDGCVKSSN